MALPAGSPSKGDVENMMLEFLESKIHDKLEAHFTKSLDSFVPLVQKRIEMNLGAILKVQSDKVDVAAANVRVLYDKAAAAFAETEQRINSSRSTKRQSRTRTGKQKQRHN